MNINNINADNVLFLNNIDIIYNNFIIILNKIDIKDNSPFFDKLNSFYNEYKKYINSNVFSIQNSYFYIILNTLYSLLQYLSYTLENYYFKYINISSVRENYCLKQKTIFKQFRDKLVHFRQSIYNKQIPEITDIVNYIYTFNTLCNTTKFDKSESLINSLIFIDNKNNIINTNINNTISKNKKKIKVNKNKNIFLV